MQCNSCAFNVCALKWTKSRERDYDYMTTGLLSHTWNEDERKRKRKMRWLNKTCQVVVVVCNSRTEKAAAVHTDWVEDCNWEIAGGGGGQNWRERGAELVEEYSHQKGRAAPEFGGHH